MADDNLVLEHLRAIRGELKALSSDVLDLRHRVSSLEQQTSGMRADLTHYVARQDQALDRLGRVERRLELSE